MSKARNGAMALRLAGGLGLLGMPFFLIGGAVLVLLIIVVVVASFSLSTAEEPETASASVHCAAPGAEDSEDSDEADDANTSSGSPEAEVPEEYVEAVNDAAQEAGVDASVIAAQIYYESGWRDTAQSHRGAQGLAQFMPGTWRSEWGNINDPFDSIAAQGIYLGEIRAEMEPHADDDEELLRLMLAGYNAGSGAVASFNHNLDDMFSSGDPLNPNSYSGQTAPYVENIISASNGMSGAFCSIPQGDLVEAATHLAWDDLRTTDRRLTNFTEFAAQPRHGESESKAEYVETSQDVHSDINYAFFTDCGAYVSTVVRSSGIDPDFAIRGTGEIEKYIKESSQWDTFTVTNEDELQPGDVLVARFSGGAAGHTYIYTGERNVTEEANDRAVGASLGERPPSGHGVALTGGSGPGMVPYTVGRYVGDE